MQGYKHHTVLYNKLGLKCVILGEAAEPMGTGGQIPGRDRPRPVLRDSPHTPLELELQPPLRAGSKLAALGLSSSSGNLAFLSTFTFSQPVFLPLLKTPARNRA